MSASDDSTRPLSVAELLARNGTIGSPPVGGRRRRRRRNSDGVSVAELTGEIPVIRTGEIPMVVTEDDSTDEEVTAEEVTGEEVTDEEVTYEEVTGEEVTGEEVTYEEVTYEEVTAEEAVAEEAVAVYSELYDEESAVPAGLVESSETVVVYTSAEVPEYQSEYTSEAAPERVAQDVTEVEAPGVEATEPEAPEVAPEVEVEAEAEVQVEVGDSAVEPLPLAGDPRPRRSEGPQRGYDPRPARRSSGAEQMAYDPVDESVNLDDLVEEHVEDVEQLRSYLSASQDTLFSGGTVADDLARRGFSDGEDYGTDQTVATASGPARPQQVGSTLWNSVLAVVQSLIAVVFGAALFIGFDQLWRWNNLVALILSVLVVLSLAAAVRYFRKTEDIVSTLTAVAVGLLVTLGPLALQST